MTTINNYESLIEKVGGIEKARAIVEGAPERATGINHVDDDEYNTYVITKPEWSIINKHAYWHVDALTGSGCWKSMANVFGGYDLLLGLIELNDLRSAIEHHYYGRSEAEELAAYAELSHEKIEGGAMLVGDFSEARKIIDKQLESDHVTDIRNHISPNTKVVEL